MQHIHRGLASAEEVHQVNLVFCGSLLCQKAPAEGELKNNSPAEGAEKRTNSKSSAEKAIPLQKGMGKAKHSLCRRGCARKPLQKRLQEYLA